jgi:hypothetical protein
LIVTPISPALYELLPLGLIPRGGFEVVALTLSTIAAFLGRDAHLPWVAAGPMERLTVLRDGLLLCCAYPTLAIVLTRPNVGLAPDWVERLTAHPMFPAWLRGDPATAITRQTPQTSSRALGP